METTETISEFFSKTLNLVNEMKANGDAVEDSAIVEKILRSFPEKFESKVTAIEECNTVATMTLNELLDFGHIATEYPKPRKTVANNYKANFKANIAGSQEEETKEQKDENMLLTCHTAEEQPQLKWYLDTGCSNHMCGRKDLFEKLDESVRSTIKFGLHQNLLSMGQLSERGYYMNIYNVLCFIRDRRRRLIAKVQMTKNRLFPLNIQHQKKSCYNSSVHNDSWRNKRMGHVNFNSLQILAKKEMVSGLPSLNFQNQDVKIASLASSTESHSLSTNLEELINN
ncbi:uncharacterized protein LOC113312970 [Papaver somniferum]|uniref:uncharacterized protein LOC113312970 n=1 Tax=Papaver somniferum TaxID=3469 RepID=UPI000E6FA26D|nr:uncharacterized protein LOC113312970 [Papaver somniferum]